MSHAGPEINAGTLRRSDVVGRGEYRGGVNHQSVRWIPEMSKGQGSSKPAQVQFAREVQPERNNQDSSAAARQQGPHGRRVYQRLRTAISPDNVINGTYSIGKKLGEGSFGVIYQGTNILSKDPVAIKFEPKKTDAPQLADEHRFYKMINPSIGFPKCYYFGREGPYSVLCIELLGPSLEDLFDLCGRKFSVKTVCMAAKQMLARIWTIHENKYIYRDIKPDNFLIGRALRATEPSHFDVYDPSPAPPNFDSKIVDYYRSLQGRILDKHTPENPHPSSLIYIVDFGMAKQYFDPYTQSHIPYREKKSLSGTARYMSINTHLGIEQSRRDDLEALGHVLMYFLRGSLPWQGLRGATNKQKYEKIGGKKQSTLIRSLCAGYPKEFETYLAYTRSLKFSETPNYKYLIKLFDNVLEKIGERDDGIFDWMIEMDNQAEKTQLRENAWRRREEREHSNMCKSWQNQYYNNMLHKQEIPVLSQTLPHQMMPPALPPPSLQYDRTPPISKITTSRNAAPSKPYQQDHSPRYAPHRDQAQILQKRRSIALENYRVNPGLSTSADQPYKGMPTSHHQSSSKPFCPSGDNSRASPEFTTSSDRYVNGAPDHSTPPHRPPHKHPYSPSRAPDGFPLKIPPDPPDITQKLSHSPRTEKVSSSHHSPSACERPLQPSSASPDNPSSTHSSSQNRTAPPVSRIHQEPPVGFPSSAPLFASAPDMSLSHPPREIPTTDIAASPSISTDKARLSNRKSANAAISPTFAPRTSRFNKSFTIFKKDRNTHDTAKDFSPLTNSFAQDSQQSESSPIPHPAQRGLENTRKSQRSANKLKEALRSRWKKLFKK